MRVCLLSAWVALSALAGGAQGAIVVGTSDAGGWPASPTLQTFNPGSVTPDSGATVKDNRVLAQTFQLTESIDLNSFYIQTQTIGGATFSVDIFAVTDVNASGAAPAVTGGSLASGTNLTFATGLTGSPFEARFDLTSPLRLDATTGAAGYAVVITSIEPTATTTDAFQWRIVTSANALANPYALGRYYGRESTGAGAAGNGATADASLALVGTSVPEPTFLGVATFGLAVTLLRRRRS